MKKEIEILQEAQKIVDRAWAISPCSAQHEVAQKLKRVRTYLEDRLDVLFYVYVDVQ